MWVEDDAGAPQRAVVVLDDRPVVRLGLHVALADLPAAAGVLLVGRVPDALDVIRSAARRGCTVVVVLDHADGPGRAAAALEAGARGVALVGGSIAELVAVVRRATAGELAVVRAVAERLDALADLRRRFTPREREVLRLYATGLPAKSVARRTGVGEETVKTYLKRVREKASRAGLPAQTRIDLADLARRLDLL